MPIKVTGAGGFHPEKFDMNKQRLSTATRREKEAAIAEIRKEKPTPTRAEITQLKGMAQNTSSTNSPLRTSFDWIKALHKSGETR